MRVVWTHRAYRHLDEIQDFIAKESPRAAQALVNDILDRTELLLSVNPQLGRPGRIAETRELVLADTQYLIVYHLGSEVEVIAVRHSKREWPEAFS